MKEFKIFIASSNDEKDERNIIRDFLLTVSKETHDFGIEFIPVMWEMESVNFSPGLSPKQNAYNKKLISSDMAFFFFGKRVGEYTIEEFKIACEQVESQSDLKVFVYFKEVEMGSTSSMKQEDAENLGNVLKLKKFIYEKLKQVPGEFENASELLKNVTRDILNAVLPVMRKKPQSNNIERLVTLYQETSIPSLRIKREKIINDAINSLFFLRYGLSPDELSNKNFYDLLHTIISNTPEGAEINALSVMLKSEWDDSEDEKQFWADNRDAVKRKVNLERISRASHPCGEHRHLSLWKRRDRVVGHTDIIGKKHLLGKAPQEPGNPVSKFGNSNPSVFQLALNVRITHDRTCDQLREHGDIGSETDQIPLHAYIVFIHIYNIR